MTMNNTDFQAKRIAYREGLAYLKDLVKKRGFTKDSVTIDDILHGAVVVKMTDEEKKTYPETLFKVGWIGENFISELFDTKTNGCIFRVLHDEPYRGPFPPTYEFAGEAWRKRATIVAKEEIYGFDIDPVYFGLTTVPARLLRQIIDVTERRLNTDLITNEGAKELSIRFILSYEGCVGCSYREQTEVIRLCGMPGITKNKYGVLLTSVPEEIQNRIRDELGFDFTITATDKTALMKTAPGIREIGIPDLGTSCNLNANDYSGDSVEIIEWLVSIKY